MAACHGNMFILVNVDKHRDIMGDIVKCLVADYGVPISIVDNIQKICPKCSATTSEADVSSATATNSDEQGHVDESSSSGESDPKKRKIERNLSQKSIKQEVNTIDEKATEVFGTVLAALQNGRSHELPQFSAPPTGNSGPSSDDGASNSNDVYEVEDEDYNTSPWANTDFLTNFITSQPSIFHANGADLSNTNKSPSAVSQTSSSQQKRIPPMMTVNGKTRRGRIVYSQQELNILEKYYEEDPNACADPLKRDIMCKRLEIDYHRLKVWFQNRRRKDKVRSQEEAAASFHIPNGQEFS